MAATDACDDGDWAKDALLNPHLAAAVILSFRQRSRVDPDAVDDTMPSTSAPTRPMEWGRKIKRSRMMKIPRIFSIMREEEEETAKVVATAEEEEEEEQLEKKKGKRRPSPQSPLEGYSSASASGGEERSRAGRPTGVSIAEVEEHRVKVAGATNLCAPKSSTNPASCHARRPSSKKMKVELQAVQVSLLEDKANLLKEMENWRRTLEQLRVDNDKLQLLFKLAKQFETIQQTVGERRPISLPSSSSCPRSKDFIQLPDLNEPLPDC